MDAHRPTDAQRGMMHHTSDKPISSSDIWIPYDGGTVHECACSVALAGNKGATAGESSKQRGESSQAENDGRG
jgi:hypothetical protein